MQYNAKLEYLTMNSHWHTAVHSWRAAVHTLHAVSHLAILSVPHDVNPHPKTNTTQELWSANTHNNITIIPTCNRLASSDSDLLIIEGKQEMLAPDPER